jgi:hypothetical protein
MSNASTETHFAYIVAQDNELLSTPSVIGGNAPDRHQLIEEAAFIVFS